MSIQSIQLRKNLPKIVSSLMFVAILAIWISSHAIANAEIATTAHNVIVPDYAHNFEVIKHHYQLGGGCSDQEGFYGLGMHCTTGLNDTTFHADYLYNDHLTLLCVSSGILK